MKYIGIININIFQIQKHIDKYNYIYHKLIHIKILCLSKDI